MTSNVRLTREVDPVEDRRLELEERHRLARDELRAMDQDLHRRGRDPHDHAALVAGVDQLDGLLLGEGRVGDDDLVGLVLGDDVADLLQRPERAQAVVGPRRQRDEADDLDRAVPARGLQRVGDGLDLLAGADEDRAALVAGGAEQRARALLVGKARGRHVGDREEERAVEDVVAGELLTVDDGEDERHQRRLKQRGDDARQAGALRALRVQARAREQQRGDQERERHVVLGLLPGDARVPGVARPPPSDTGR